MGFSIFNSLKKRKKKSPFVVFRVMMRNIVLDIKVSLNVIGNMRTRLEQTVVLRGFWRNKKLLAAVGRRKEWKKTCVQHNPMTASHVSLGMEQARHSIALSNHTSSNNTN